MKNMLRQNLFLMRKKVSTYVILAMMFGFGFLTAIMHQEESAEADIVCGFSELFAGSTGVAMLLCGIASVLFLGTDLKDGFIKNIAGTVRNKMAYVLPKTIVLAGYHVISLLAMAGGTLLGCVLTFDSLGEFEALPFLRYFGILCLLLTGLTMVLAFFVFFLRNSGGPVAMAIFLGSGLYYNIVYALLGALLNKAGIEFDFSKISLTMQIGMLQPAGTGSELLHACTVGVCYLLIFGLLTKYAVTKKDIA